MKRSEDIFACHYFSRIRLRADEYKIVVHHIPALNKPTLSDELFFSCFIMHKRDIGITAADLGLLTSAFFLLFALVQPVQEA